MPTETWTRLPEARRSAVLDAAEAEFAAHGFSRGSLNVIAREAGVAKGSLFQYFDDKADLFEHLAELAADRVGAELDSRIADIDWTVGFFPGLGRVLEIWTEHFRTHPIDRSLSAAVALEPDPETRRAVRAVVDERTIAFVRPMLVEAKDKGALRADADLDAFLALLLLVLPQLALAPTYPDLDPVLGLGGLDPAEGIGRILAVFEAAFGAR